LVTPVAPRCIVGLRSISRCRVTAWAGTYHTHDMPAPRIDAGGGGRPRGQVFTEKPPWAPGGRSGQAWDRSARLPLPPSAIRGSVRRRARDRLHRRPDCSAAARVPRLVDRVDLLLLAGDHRWGRQLGLRLAHSVNAG